MKFLPLSNSLSLLILRLVFGGAMIYGHGWKKLMKLTGPGPYDFSDPIGLGVTPSLILIVIAEVVGPVLVILGLFTRWATIPTIIAMGVVLFIVHADDPFGSKEKALLYLVGFLVLLLAGPGKYSLDNRLHS